MGARAAQALTAAALFLAACARLPDDALAPGARFPVAAVADAPAQVVWVVRPEDYLTCQTAAGEIRELQRQAGPRVPFTVLYVGPHGSWLEQFLARQRIRATVTVIGDDAFRRAFRRAPGPWLYLLRRGVVRGVLPGAGYLRPAQSWGEMIRADTRDDTVRAAGAAAHSSEGAQP